MGQVDWRFCVRCEAMFFDGAASKGSCPSGGGHAAMGFNFDLPFDIPESANDQGGWHFCNKCFVMFFDGYPNKGVCSAGGGHEGHGSLNFVLHHDAAISDAQNSWRFCGRCESMFFDGSPNKGVCPAGGGHAAMGFDFWLPHHDEVQSFDTGPITSDLPLGCSAHITITKSGNYTLFRHAHDSGFDNIRYTLTAVLMSPSGFGVAFTHQGHVEGTSAGIPLGTPQRNDDATESGFNQAIKDEFDSMINARFIGRLTGTDVLLAGFNDFVQQTAEDAAKAVGKAAVEALVSIVV